MYSKKDHTFVVCAYKESIFLEECIKSVLNQSIKSQIVISTSTDNEWIQSIADKYHISVYVNSGKSGIAEDWNFAYQQCKTRLITLTHQDDIYCPLYLEKVLAGINESRKPLIAFTDYCEIREGKVVEQNTLLKIKRMLLLPLKIRGWQKSRFVRRRVLSMGSAICCPSVTLVKDNLTEPIFRPGMKSNIDWEAWEKISRYEGSFVYCCEKLMFHRIHEESTTTDIIKDGQRGKEDLMMFSKFWPHFVSAIICKVYQLAEKSNRMRKG